MLFYESERSDQHNYLYCQRDHNFNFPAHLHHSFEFLCVQSGTLACTLETEQYEVHPGEALLVLPDQIHSYRTIGESQSVLWVFSTDWVPEFISQLGQREFITPVFRMEAAPLMELLWPGGNRCKQLAGLYLICGTALEQCFLQPRPVPDVDAHLSSKIIDYVQKNYTHTLTLEQMARDLGYNYTYLSAYFNHSLHTGFQGFINQYRISHAAALLQGSSLPITGTASSYQPMDGWFTEGDRITRDGTEYVLYYPEDYIDDYYTARSEGETPDESRAQAVPASEAVLTRSYTVGAILKEAPDFLGTGDLYLLYPYSMYEAVTGQAPAADAFWFRSSDHAASYESMGQILMELGNSRSELQDLAANGENQRAMVTVVNVFSYGFIILISLISMTNVFNTISTSIALRRREFAMLRSVGLTQRGFARMMDYECIIYGARALLWGLPASVLVTYGIYRSVAQSIAARFYIPWYSVAIAVGSVFVVVFATMLYATRKIRSENPIEALKQENL